MLETKPESNSLAKSIYRWSQWIFTPAAISFLAYLAWNSRDELSTVITDANIYFILASFIILMLPNIIAPMVSVILFKSCSSDVPYKLSANSFIKRLPARYLPGGIWHTVGRAIDFHNHGVKPRQLTTFVLLENLLSICTAFILGGAVVWFSQGLNYGWGGIAALSVLLGIVSLTFAPLVINWKIMPKNTKLVILPYLKSIGSYMCLWPFYALGFICYLLAFSGASVDLSLFEIGGYYLFAWGIGLATIFAPQGIGIFELVAGNTITTELGVTGTAALISGFRIVSLASDTSLWAIHQTASIYIKKNL